MNVADLIHEKNGLLLQNEALLAANNALVARHNAVITMVSRYLVACKSDMAESWVDGFVECGAVTIDMSYPYGFVAPVLVESLGPTEASK